MGGLSRIKNVETRSHNDIFVKEVTNLGIEI